MALTKVSGSLIGTETVTNDNISDTVRESFGPRNRIINGDMRIDQRNAGAAVTGLQNSPNYIVDRWSYRRLGTWTTFTASGQQNTTTSFSGSPNSLKITCTATESSIPANTACGFSQRIEGYNTADLKWGTSDAKTITISFSAKSSLTGEYTISISDGAGTNYRTPFSINNSEVWEKKTITFPGPTSGTWNQTNGIGPEVIIVLASSEPISSSNTWTDVGNAWGRASANHVNFASSTNNYFEITDFQLEVGSVATPFERRPFGTELVLCQRYFQKSYRQEDAVGTDESDGCSICETIASGTLTRLKMFNVSFAPLLRATPTRVAYSLNGVASRISVYNNDASQLTVSSISNPSNRTLGSFLTTSTNASASTTYAFHWTADAEL